MSFAEIHTLWVPLVRIAADASVLHGLRLVTTTPGAHRPVDALTERVVSTLVRTAELLEESAVRAEDHARRNAQFHGRRHQLRAHCGCVGSAAETIGAYEQVSGHARTTLL